MPVLPHSRLALLERAGAKFPHHAAQARIAEEVASFNGLSSLGLRVGLVQRGGDFREVLGRAGAAHGFRDGEVGNALEGMQGVVADVVLQGRVAFDGNRLFPVVEEQVRQTYAAQFHGVQIAAFVGTAHDEFRAAAADVDEQTQRVRMLQSAGNAEIDQTGFFLPGDCREGNAGLFPDAG